MRSPASRPEARPLERALAAALAAAAVTTLALACLRAWNRPHIPFDGWAYHLPFAARLHGLGGDTFLIAPELRRMFEGFPLLAEWLQGALWRATGTLRAAALVNLAALVAVVAYAAAAFRLPTAALVFGFLAVPMVAIHAPSVYIDLFVGCAAALQAIAGLRLLELVAEPGSPPARRGQLAVHAAIFLIGAAAAGNSKFMGEAIVLVVAGFVGCRLFDRRLPARVRIGLAGLALAGALAGGVSMLSNLVRHGRPLHPFSTSQLSRPSRPKPSRASASQPPAPAAPAPTGPAVESDGSALPYPHFFRHGIRPIGFVVSATELDWWIRGIEPLYNIDSNAGDSPRRYESFRSGGWWGLYVVGQLALLGVEIRRRRRLGWGPGERRMVALLGVATVAICLTPNSYLLRYWLFWPLLLVTATTRLAVARRGERSRLVLAGALGATFLVSYFALPTQADFAPRPVHRYDAATLRARLHPELRRAIEAGERFCLDGDHFPGTFRYSAAVLGGRHVIEQIRGGRPCTVYPRLDVPARWRPPGAAVR